MAVGLVNNATTSVNLVADVVTDGGEAALEALSLGVDSSGGRQIKGQLFVTVPVTEQGAPLTVYASDDGLGAVPAFSASTATTTSARVDLTATIYDQAFEEYDIFGASKKDDRPQKSDVRF